jgi:GGDEF domain-containing protein
MVVRSWKDGVRAVISITLLSVLVSVLIAWGIAMLLDKKLELVFVVAVPVMGVPIFVIPLLRANLRLYQTRAELERLVRTDSLTGLANRRSFLEEATSLFSSPAADKDDIAVMMVDIDHFKRINDSCGHDHGDRVLKLVANAIVSVALQEHPGHVLVGRIGGEEFVVLAHGVDASGRGKTLSGNAAAGMLKIRPRDGAHGEHRRCHAQRGRNLCAGPEGRRYCGL